MQLRLIGDVHQNYDELVRLQKGADYSIALGDIGFNYHNLTQLYEQGNINPTRNFMFAGNHDNHRLLKVNLPNYFLNRYGAFCLADKWFFYASGGWSIDWKRRTPGLDWFPEEELTDVEIVDMIALAEAVQPDYILTHEGPYCVVPYVTNPSFAQAFGYGPNIPTRTNQALMEVLRVTRAKKHFFGHYHWSGGKTFTVPGFNTEFVHLDMIRTNYNGFIYPGSTYELEI